ncbi:MAG: biotin/lipoyl-binding protein, partial [Pseudomonadota bacterium]
MQGPVSGGSFRVLSLAFVLILSACGANDVEPASEGARPAKLLQLTEATTQQSNSLPAVVRSVRTTDLAFQVGGQITEWNAIDGAPLRRGQVIARLDARSFQAAVEQAEAQYNNANSEYERALRLIEEAMLDGRLSRQHTDHLRRLENIRVAMAMRRDQHLFVE